MSGNDLHLPNLTIRGFRGIQDLSMERLGRVTLIAGKNGVGKSTVLDAVQIYASRGQHSVLTRVLESREEFSRLVDEDRGELPVEDWDALFYGRQVSQSNPIVIGSTGSSQYISIDASPVNEEEVARFGRHWSEDFSREDMRALRVSLFGKDQATPLFTSTKIWRHRSTLTETEIPGGTRSEFLGPSVIGSIDIGRLWDKVALTDDENRAVEALRLVFGDTIERAAVIGDEKFRLSFWSAGSGENCGPGTSGAFAESG